MNRKTTTVATPAGPVRLAYVDAGSGPELVLLHGMFGDYLDWEPVIGPLARQFRVLALDLPGFGNSEKPDITYDASLFVSATDGLLRAVEAPKAILVGNSFGGLVALLFALEHPDMLDGLVLVGSGGLQPFDDESRSRAERLFTYENLLALTPQGQTSMFAPIFAGTSEARHRYLEKQNAKLGRIDFPAYARALARTIRFVMHTSCETRLHELRCRSLLLWGEHDTIVPPEVALRAAARLPRCQVKLLAGCGHAPQLECPAAFVTAVEEFAAPGADS